MTIDYLYVCLSNVRAHRADELLLLVVCFFFFPFYILFGCFASL